MSDARQNNLALIKDNNAFDVVVVGGGVNGIGVYRDLSLQGLRVLLVEKNDFASGCSAAPSRMIHGGLRYLENGEFDLVRESLLERDALLRNAPHMVKPLPTVIPITSLFSGMLNSAASFLGRQGKPSSRGALPIKLGLGLYDWVTRKSRAVPRHAFFGGAETRRRWPDITAQAKCSAVYYDAWISHPERLCLEMISDVGEAAPHCVALNYAELQKSGDTYTLTCQRSGKSLDIKPRTIVHATGAWLDKSVSNLAGAPEKKMVAGTKGSHLIIDNPALEKALGGHMAYFENADGRVCIVFPYQGKVLAGSTDIRVEEAARVRCEADELNYILDSLRLVFPNIEMSATDVVFSYSGIRPLPQSTQEFTGRISRGHDVKVLPGDVPQFCMVGGKWTTFRAFAEQTADMVLQELGKPRRRDTRNLAIGGGKGYSEQSEVLTQALQHRFAISSDRARHLMSHYGSAAASVQAFCTSLGGDVSLGEGVQYSKAEIRRLITDEHVQTLADIALRRTSLAITGQISLGLIGGLAQVLSEELSLSAAETTAQKNQLIEELSDFYGVTPQMLAERTKQWSMKCA
ncbi:glycerol-3-phosphate dehydrogenase/oxidase [Shimia sagamensis]|uniref:Glycerol-3-phosphate dehydrogenase n=1 Tax=Shimia sagamensis TaxID=1566352 RepID=A0ABY1P132_9RHOB|nr:glycerol-3-phosphate dehydrogenase/oxidase [Shimia sagamensis]SMP23437.1 glycerol-3-phosphate dehydrogenase [Shimia sagamensis]